MDEGKRPSAGLKYELAGTGPQRAIGATVLVVDDDAEMTRLIGAVLASRGLATVSAYDAVQGFMVAQRLQPKFMLVDWHMPAGGGLQLLRQLRLLIPVLGIVYIYRLFEIIPAIFIKSQSVRNHWQQASELLVASMILAMAVNSTIKLRRENMFQVSSPRGSFITSNEIGEPLAEAVKYMREHTPAGASVLTLPLFTTLNFLADRDYPLKEELALPGFLSDEKEMEAIEQIKSHKVNLILIVNITTPAFGNRVFGADYNLELMRWIAENYHLAARFDPKTIRNGGGPKLGDTQFFIMAYEKN